MDERLPRKLAAILYADVAEYSRLTGDDEDTTHRRLREYLDLVSRSVEHHRGHVMHYAGDAVLAMFDSVVDSLACAAQIQNVLLSRNNDVPEDRKVRFRIGVNLGDVIEDRGDIYGDGVNVAARLECLAEPGGICVSESVRTAVGNKLPLEFDFLGDQSVKNIAQPVRTYRVAARRVHEDKTPRSDVKVGRLGRRSLISAVVLVLLGVAVGAGIWVSTGDLRPLPTSDEEVVRRGSDKPSLAVLPFANMSADPNQEYFSDGMTDDLITDLAKISGLLVIARNSVFTYKGKNVKVQQIARDLGVQYVLEGSVRRVGESVRINAQLIDVSSGGHLWADRYDGSIVDIFQLQDQVTSSIVAALKVTLTPQETKATTVQRTIDVAAYDIFLRGQEHLLRRTPEDAAMAVDLFHQAIAIEPDYSRAYAGLAQAYWDHSLDPTFNTLVGLDTGQDDTSYANDVIAWIYLEKTREKPSSQSHTLIARMLQRQRRFDEAIQEARQAVALGPNEPAAHDVLIENLIYSGSPQEAIALVQESNRLDPTLPGEKLFLKGMAQYAMRQLEASLSTLERARNHNPKQSRYAAIQAAALAELGRQEEAESALRVYLAGLLTYATLNWTMFHWPFQDSETAERLANGLLQAGLQPSPKPYYFVASNDRLTTDEIRSLVSNRVMIGLDRGPTGLEDDFEVWRDERAQITQQGFLTYFRDGPSRIENDLLCDPWWDFGSYCVAIYRNDGGTAGEKDEYIFFTLASTFTFSVFDSTD